MRDPEALASLHARTAAVRVTGTEPRRHDSAVTMLEPLDASASVHRPEQLWKIEQNVQRVPIPHIPFSPRDFLCI